MKNATKIAAATVLFAAIAFPAFATEDHLMNDVAHSRMTVQKSAPSGAIYNRAPAVLPDFQLGGRGLGGLR